MKNLKLSEKILMSFFICLYIEKGQDNIISTQKALKKITFFNDYSLHGFQIILYRLQNKKYINIENTPQFAQIKKYSITNETKEKIKNLSYKEIKEYIKIFQLNKITNPINQPKENIKTSKRIKTNKTKTKNK